ncbi:chloride channel protein [uncultured Actinomyces sp.]|uniref:chloride channel protein n=1 Tax=uncultured Actinomyces sp. TaxID=249061 RepID=UPI00288A0F9B|nr:chloride channel protein [uncultured Actinomyces sp.]
MTEHAAARRRRGRVLGLFRHHRSGLFALAVLVGAGSGGAAVLFRLGIEHWTLLLTGAGDYTLSLGPSFGLLSFAGRRFVLIAPVLSGLLIGPLMARLGRTRTGHGVSGVMSSAQHGDGSMAPLPALASTAAATLTIGGGGSVGPEGPIAELGAAVSTLVSRRLGLPVHFLRLLAGAGAAAGIAAAFNAPLAGAFFAMEVVLLDFTLDAFAFVVLACVSSTVLSHHLLGTTLSLSLPRLDLAGDAQLGWVALLGVIGGVAGVGFSRCVSVTADLTARAAGRARLPVWLRPVLGGVLVGLMLLVVPETYGESSAVLNRALDGRYTAAALLGLAVAKAVATSVTLGTGFAGGVFAPSLCIGGMLGAAMGMLAAPDSPTAAAVFGVIGMGAVFSGAARAPITGVVLIIEMTGQYDLLVPLMLAVVLATVTGRFLTRTTIYTETLRRRGQDPEDPMRTTLVGRADARSLMREPPAVLDEDDPPARAAAEMARTGSTVLPVTRRPGPPGIRAGTAPPAGVGPAVGAAPSAVSDGAWPAAPPGTTTEADGTGPVDAGPAQPGDPAGAGPAQSGESDRAPAASAVAPADDEDGILLGCLDAVTLAQAALDPRAADRVGELPLSEHHVLASDGATSVLGALVRDGFSALPVVEARPRGFALVGWVTREQMVERVYRQQRRAFEEAQVRTSLGARVQQRWRGRSART